MSRKTGRIISVLLVLALLFAFTGCSKEESGSTAAAPAAAATQAPAASAPAETEESTAPAETAAAAAEGPDLSKNVELRFNLAYGNRSRTMTYNQNSPLTLSDGTTVTAGMLKPMWSYVAGKLNSTFVDVGIQDAQASDMIRTEAATNFSNANIFGGNSIASQLVQYGTRGMFVNLNDLMEQGLMPNFKAYLDANPTVRQYITAYDGGIYYAPYIAEVGGMARQYIIRETWVTKLLDAENAAYDTTPFTTYYEGFYIGDNVRTGENGGTVEPKPGVFVTKKTAENIIEIQNALEVKNGETLTKALIDYIGRNYDYEKPSDLFLSDTAAYDIDELTALFRCIRANGLYLTDGARADVWPFFVRQSSYREDLVRFSTYFGGVRTNGSDSYDARWTIDENGQLQYTYSTEDMFNVLCYLSDWNAEGLIHRDMYDLTNKTNFRSALWGSDGTEAAQYGFMTYDWIQSSTADALNQDTVVILPPVAKVNGVWQYYIDNARVIKPDGWAISVAGSTEEEIERAAAVFDYFFSEEGHIVQNYGLLMDIDPDKVFTGPDGIDYPAYTDWVFDTTKRVANGDLSVFLRDWIGSQMPIGYQKEIGFEYNSTSERGFEGWELLGGSTVTIPSYSGEGPEGDNPNYYTLIPPMFSLTDRQQETLNTSVNLNNQNIVDYMFNVIRYRTLGNAPSGTEVADDYSEYLSYFTDRGIDTYISIYQAAYQNMLAMNE